MKAGFWLYMKSFITTHDSHATERHRDTETERQRDRETERQRDRETESVL